MTFEQLKAKLGMDHLKSGDFTQHANGGGWVYKDASVSVKTLIGENAVVWGGTIRGGTIEGGTIRGGTIYGGTIEGGTIRGGTIRGGTIEGGTIRGGTIYGGTIEGGTIRGGTIYGGTIRGGTIRGGTIYGGTIVDGVWKTAPLFVTGSRHPLSNAKPGYIQIGCKCETYAWWLSQEGTRFAARNGYTPAEIREYKDHVRHFVKRGAPLPKVAPVKRKKVTKKQPVAAKEGN